MATSQQKNTLTPSASVGRFQQPHLVTRGRLSWETIPHLGSAAQIDGRGRVVAKIHKLGKMWSLRVDGYLWAVTPDMGVARMNAIPGQKIREVPIKAFKSIAAAQREAELILGEEGLS